MTREERIMNDAMEAMKGGEDFIRENAKEIPFLIRDLYIRINELQTKLDSEKDYRDWIIKNRMKGYICGYLTRTTGEQFTAHQNAETYEKEKIELRR